MENRHDAHEDLKGIIANRIEEIREKTGVSVRYLAQVCGISYGSMRKVLNKQNLLRLEALISIADYFAVPLDFLCGRCSEKTAKDILSDYPKHFMEIKRASFEAYAGSRRKYAIRESNKVPKYYEFPWPYNVLDLVRNKETKEKVGEDQVQMLLDSIETLKPREKTILLDYYRDGKTFDQIGEEQSISKQMAFTIAKRAVKRLRSLYQGFIV